MATVRGVAVGAGVLVGRAVAAAAWGIGVLVGCSMAGAWVAAAGCWAAGAAVGAAGASAPPQAMPTIRAAAPAISGNVRKNGRPRVDGFIVGSFLRLDIAVPLSRTGIEGLISATQQYNPRTRPIVKLATIYEIRAGMLDHPINAVNR